MKKDQKHLMIWITALSLVIITIVIIDWKVDDEIYTVKVDYCDSDSLDLEVAKVVCVNLCTEKLSYKDDLLKECYISCRN